jgi:hypothetical protein
MDALLDGLGASTSEGVTFYHSVLFDVCFALAHRAGAGGATQQGAPFQFVKAPAPAVEAFISDPATVRTGKTDTTCADFAADTALGRTSKLHDITGLGGAVCPHGFVLAVHDVFTGERWAYSTFMLIWLMLHGIFPLFWWYDINCRYRPHVQAWRRWRWLLGP